jgi:hypothetical protein
MIGLIVQTGTSLNISATSMSSMGCETFQLLYSGSTQSFTSFVIFHDMAPQLESSTPLPSCLVLIAVGSTAHKQAFNGMAIHALTFLQ